MINKILIIGIFVLLSNIQLYAGQCTDGFGGFVPDSTCSTDSDCDQFGLGYTCDLSSGTGGTLPGGGNGTPSATNNPTVNDITFTLSSQSDQHTFTSSELNYQDLDADTITAIQIQQAGTYGKFYIDANNNSQYDSGEDAPVQGQSGSNIQTDFEASKLKYVPNSTLTNTSSIQDGTGLIVYNSAGESVVSFVTITIPAATVTYTPITNCQTQVTDTCNQCNTGYTLNNNTCIIANNTPTITSTAITTVDEDKQYSYTFAASDVDSGDTLTYSASTLPSWLSFNVPTGLLSGTPTNSDVGIHNVTLGVNDGTVDVNQTFTITVNHVNHAPTAITLSNNSITENNASDTTIGTLSATDTDVGDTHTFSFCGGSDDNNFILSNATLQANSVFDYETKSSYNICVRVEDNSSATFDKNITISVSNVNEAPTVTTTALTSIDQDSAYKYILGATDPEDDSLSWSVTSGTALPTWLSLGTSATVTTLAGTGSYDYADGNATSASFKYPYGVAVDANGNVYVADTSNNLIRKIDSNGNVTTLAGTSSYNYADGNATSASFRSPYGVAVDASGNIYVADTSNNLIRKIDSNGNVTTLAGTSSYNYADGNATSASFRSPYGVAVDASGNVYVADADNNRIRRIDANGNVTTLAGTSTPGHADGNATSSSFNYPIGVAVDASGNVYVADYNNHLIRKIDTDGNVTTLAGTGSNDYADGNATSASFKYPYGVAVDANGNVYVADTDNNRIRKIDANGNVTTLAGTSTPGHADGNATSASFESPHGIAVNASGNVYVADTSDNRIRKITQSDRLIGTPTNADVSTYDINLTVKDGNGGITYQNFTITVNAVNHAPTAITLSNNSITENNASDTTIGTLSATDTDVGDTHTFSFCGGSDDNNFTISNATLQANAVFDFETKASYSICVRVTDGSSATFDKNITISVSDVNEAPTVTTTALTSIDQDSAYKYILGANDPEGDSLSWSVTSGTTLPSWLNLSTDATVTTLAGTGSSGHADGNRTSASFTSPYGVAVDASGNVYVADTDNHLIRKIDTNGNVTTLAGKGSYDYPSGVAVDASGNVYVADAGHNLIKKIDSDGNVTTLDGKGSYDYPSGVAVDASGNVYVADAGHNLIKKIDSDGNVTTLAGSGTDNYADGNATSASFSHPFDVTVDASGNVYVADYANHLIRKIDSDGNVTTLARTGSYNYPSGVAVDSSGNVYVADTGNHLIRKIDSDANVTTLAGTGSIGHADGNRTSASFYYPQGVAVDASGNVYVADTDNNLIRKITPSATNLIGTPTHAGTYDINLTVKDGNGGITYQNFTITVNAVNNAPTAITLSNNSITENNASDATIGTLSATDADVGDTHTFSFCGGSDDNNFTLSNATLQANAVFDYETKTSYNICVRVTDGSSATFDKNITISVSNVNEAPTVTTTALMSIDQDSAYKYILGATDPEGDSVSWSVTSGTILPSWLSLSTAATVTTLAGSGSYGYANGNATSASFKYPHGVAVDASGNVYVADTDNNRIRKIDANGNVTTLAGSGSYGYANGNATSASFEYPYGVAVDVSGNVYVADTNNNLIRKIDANGNVTTLAGSGSYGYANGNTTFASFKHPSGVAVDASGNVYVGDSGNHRIRKIDADGNVTTLAGTGSAGYADGNATSASFKHPSGVAVDASGNVYVADSANNLIRKIDANGNVTTFAGTSTAGYADGNATSASFYYPTGVAVDASGNVYVADYGNHLIRKIDTDGNVTTLAGTGSAGYADGNATSASFVYPYGVAVDASGNVYVADYGNLLIRKITPSPINLIGTPTKADVGTYDINLTVKDGNGGITYQNFTIEVKPSIIAVVGTSCDDGNASTLNDVYISTTECKGTTFTQTTSTTTNKDGGLEETFTYTSGDSNTTISRLVQTSADTTTQRDGNGTNTYTNTTNGISSEVKVTASGSMNIAINSDKTDGSNQSTSSNISVDGVKDANVSMNKDGSVKLSVGSGSAKVAIDVTKGIVQITAADGSKVDLGDVDTKNITVKKVGNKVVISAGTKVLHTSIARSIRGIGGAIYSTDVSLDFNEDGTVIVKKVVDLDKDGKELFDNTPFTKDTIINAGHKTKVINGSLKIQNISNRLIEFK